MPGDDGGPEWEALLARAAGRADAPPPGGRPPLLVRDALSLAFGPSYADQVNDGGKISRRYARQIAGQESGGAAISRWTEHARDLRRIADRIESLLGADHEWEPCEAEFIRLRDLLIQEVVRRPDKAFAATRLRRVHKTLQAYIRATRLVLKATAGEDKYTVKGRALVLHRWYTDLQDAWTGAGLQLPDTEQPRYDRSDAGKIYVAGTKSRKVDPRYALWLELGMEGRPVQILRAKRTDLHDRSDLFPGGVFKGPGTRNKHGLVYAFVPAHRARVDGYLNGYLAEFEAAYREGRIRDYPLFPAGALVGGIIPFSPGARAIGYRQFLGFPAAAIKRPKPSGYYILEQVAKVPNQRGRGPYALKYTIANLVPQAAVQAGIGDQVVMNLATAHDTPGTATLYRSKVRRDPAVLLGVGKVLWEVRKLLTEAADPASSASVTRQASAADRVSTFRTGFEGISILLGSGEELFVPWEAVKKASHDLPPRGILGWAEGLDLDDDATHLRHLGYNISIDVPALARQARQFQRIRGSAPPGAPSIKPGCFHGVANVAFRR